MAGTETAAPAVACPPSTSPFPPSIPPISPGATPDLQRVLRGGGHLLLLALLLQAFLVLVLHGHKRLKGMVTGAEGVCPYTALPSCVHGRTSSLS